MNNALGYLSREGTDFTASRGDGGWVIRMPVDRGATLVAMGSSLIQAMTRAAAALKTLQNTVAASGEIGLNLDGAQVDEISSHGAMGDEKGMSADGVAGYFD